MKYIVYVLILLISPIWIEAWIAKARHNRKTSVIDTFQNLFSRKRAFHAGDYWVVSTMILLLLIGAIHKDIANFISTFEHKTQTIQASVTSEDLEEGSGLVKPAAIAVYENEIFGSTINKLIVNKIFHAANEADLDESVKFGLNVDDLEAELKRSRFIASSSKSDILFYRSPQHTYNQFSGGYELRARMKMTEAAYPEDQLVLVSVFDQKRKIAEMVVSANDFTAENEYQEFKLPFVKKGVGEAVTVEMRSSGKANVWLDTVEISGADVDMNTFDIEDLFPDVPDVIASEGSSRHGDPERHLPGTMLFGPYDKSIPEGVYNVAFYIKVSDNSVKQPVIRIQTANIDADTDSQTIESIEVKGTDFDSPYTYQAFTLPVVRTSNGYLEYRVFFYDRAKVWIDNVMLYPTGEEIPERKKIFTGAKSSEESDEVSRNREYQEALAENEDESENNEESDLEEKENSDEGVSKLELDELMKKKDNVIDDSVTQEVLVDSTKLVTEPKDALETAEVVTKKPAEEESLDVDFEGKEENESEPSSKPASKFKFETIPAEAPEVTEKEKASDYLKDSELEGKPLTKEDPALKAAEEKAKKLEDLQKQIEDLQKELSELNN